MKKVLMIDGSIENRKHASSLLQREYEVIEAGDTIAGFELLLQHQDIVIIILDLASMYASGLEFIQKVRLTPSFIKIAIIVTAFSKEQSDEIMALSMGADDYIHKPYADKVLLSHVNSVLNNKDVLAQVELYSSLKSNILDETLNGIYVIDAINYNLYYANKAVLELLDCKNRVYSGKKCYDFFYSLSEPCKFCKLVHAYSQSSLLEVEIPCIKKTVEERVRMVEWLGRAAYIVYMHDITLQKKNREIEKERYYREFKRRLRVDMDFMAYLLINVTKGIVVEHDPHGFPVPTIVAGHPAGEFVERVLPTVIDYKKRQEFAALLQLDNLQAAYDRGETLLNIDYRRFARDQRQIMWARSSIQLMKDPQTGDLTAFLYTYDINQTRMMQDVITTAVHYDYDMISYVNLNIGKGKKFAENTKFSDMYTRTEEFLYDTVIEEFVDKWVIVRDKEQTLAKLSLKTVQQEMQTQDIYEVVIDIVTQNNEILVKKMRYANFDKEYGMVLWTSVDVTEDVKQEKKRQQELSDALMAADMRNDFKTDYLASVGRDMNVPLRNILTNIKGITARTNNKELLDCVTSIKDNTHKLVNIINDIMYLSRIECNQLVLEQENFLLSDVIYKLKLAYKKRCTSKGQKLKIEQEIFNDWCIGDFNAVYKILDNLLDNAHRYTPRGKNISIKVYEVPSNVSGYGIFRTIVEDNGAGITQKRLEHIFTPFYLDSDYVDDRGRGETSGLGLAIVKGLIERLGGNISIVSEVGRGTKVMLDLRFQLHKIKNTVGTEVLEEDISGKRILIIDNTPITTLVVRKLLSQKGVEVLFKTVSQIDAKFLAQDEELSGFDFVLFNMSIGKEHLLRELIHKVRAEDEHNVKTTPIIAMVDQVTEKEMKFALALGSNGCLARPLKFSQLHAAIVEYMQKENMLR